MILNGSYKQNIQKFAPHTFFDQKAYFKLESLDYMSRIDFNDNQQFL